MRRFFKFFFIVLILAGLGTAGCQAFTAYQADQRAKAQLNARPKLKKAKDGTSISPSMHNLKAYHLALKQQYPFLYKTAYQVPMTSPIGRDVVVPGLRRTISYDFEKQKRNATDEMTPQGMTIADRYLLLTAYDHAHQHASVIYVLDKKTGRYLRTIQVPGRPHLGGIAYDPVARNVWITGSDSDGSALLSFSMKALNEAVVKKSTQPITYNHAISLPTIERASTVTYYDDQLFVGFFNMYDHGKLAGYPIARSGPFKGSIASYRIKAVTGDVEWSDGNGSSTMDRQIQGVAFYQDLIILSQSYGSKSSRLYIFPFSALHDLDEKNAQTVIETPPYLEQLYANDGQLLMLFESGSKAYARPTITVMDRLLSVNINALLGQ